MVDRIVVFPGLGVVAPDTPLLRADDAGVLHGDGVFETLHVRGRAPWLLAEHLTRMRRSADLLSLPLPDLAPLAHQACAAWPTADEGGLRLICTRGPADGEPTTYATITGIPPTTLRERRDGIRVVTADLGVTIGRRPPWSLSAAKSLSYATNLAARRWATAQAADDVLWTTTEGYALEAPTANVVWLADGVLCTVPAAETGILPGITAAALLAAAPDLGLRTTERLVTIQELATAEAIWLSSSLRGLAEIRTLDGIPRPSSPWTRRLQTALGFPT